MAILWAGTSIADLAIPGSGVATTTAGQIGANLSEGINVNGGNIAYTPDFEPEPSLFLTTTYYQAGTNSNNLGQYLEMVTLRDINFNTVLRLAVKHVSTSEYWFSWQKWNGTAWDIVVEAPSVTLSAGGTTKRLDIETVIHASTGKIVMYLDGTKIIDFEGNTVPVGAGTPVRLGLSRYQTNTVYSAIMVSDESTLPLLMYQRLPTGNGAETDWAGDYTAVDETGVNDADFITSSVVGDEESFTFPALPANLNSKKLHTLVLSGRARGSGTPGEVKGLSRVGSTNYEATGAWPTSPIYAPQQWYFDVNPATGLQWTGTEVNGAQFGVKAA